MSVLGDRIRARMGAAASMADSVNTMPWYHGTKSPAKIANFRVGRRGAAYFTADIGHARVYGPHIFEVDLNVRKVWDFNNADDVALLMPVLHNMPNYEPWMDKELRIGDWEILEMRSIRDALTKNGYDSYFVSGDGQSIGVIDRNAIKVARDFWTNRHGDEVPRDDAEIAMEAMLAAASSDAEYLVAVESGDTAKCQAMVDAAAKAAGYNIGPVWHGTQSGRFTIFSEERSGGRGFYFSKKPDYASTYAKGADAQILSTFLKFSNPISMADFLRYGTEVGLSKSEAIAQAKKDGFDGIEGPREFVVFSPNQIKSADPVTYDDAGNIIPLSQRFNSASNDIRAIKEPRNTMDLKKKYEALKASGMIPATGRTEEIIAEDDWVRVKRMAVPEIDADSYIFTECKRETAVCIVRDADGRYLMRNEATLQSNFTPAPKVMTETLEEGETPEQAATRGLLEEYNGAPVKPLIYLGSINGTFQELHNYHIYLADGEFLMAGEDDGFEGDGSRGEERSNNITITEAEFAQVKDFISWIAFGMMKQRDAMQSMRTEADDVIDDIDKLLREGGDHGI